MGEWSSEEPHNGQLGHRNRQMVWVGGKLISSTQEKKKKKKKWKHLDHRIWELAINRHNIIIIIINNWATGIWVCIHMRPFSTLNISLVDTWSPYSINTTPTSHMAILDSTPTYLMAHY